MQAAKNEDGSWMDRRSFHDMLTSMVNEANEKFKAQVGDSSVIDLTLDIIDLTGADAFSSQRAKASAQPLICTIDLRDSVADDDNNDTNDVKRRKTRVTSRTDTTVIKYTVYKIDLVVDGEVLGTYVGMSKNYLKRFSQHAVKPPPGMRKAWAVYKPFHEFFKITAMHTTGVKEAAQVVERRLIRELGTTKGPGGFNRLRGFPGGSKQYWFLMRRGLLPVGHSKRRQ